MEKIVGEIQRLKRLYGELQGRSDAKVIDRKEFTFLLSGISTCRKVPGIPVHMGYEELYHCENEENANLAKEHLKKLFGVVDKDSLMRTCMRFYSGCDEYEQFMTFWCDAPMFDINELSPEGLQGFSQCKDLAEKFYPIVKEKGFYAWDINERITLCRTAVACGIISDDEFWELTDDWVRMAQAIYQSFAEYAISCLCGAVYEMARYDSDANQFFEINRNIVENLMGTDGAWLRNKWYDPAEREWAPLLHSNPACIVTKCAIESGEIGYMYRDEPNENFPDSGWRFFEGFESDEYVNNPDNSTICGLNTICNLCPDIMPYIYAKVGRKFGKSSQGWEEE